MEEMQPEESLEFELNIEKEKKEIEAQKYGIDTGSIFLDLESKYKSYDRSFLKERVWPALQSSLKNRYWDKINRKPAHYAGNIAPDAKYLKIQIHNFAEALEKADNEDRFPFPDYFILYDQGGPKHLINLGEQNLLEKDFPEYLLFFSLKLSLLHFSEVRDFLSFHLKQTFNGDLSELGSFLKEANLLYPDLVSRFQSQIEDFTLKQNLPENKIKEEGGAPESGKTPTIGQFVLVFHYLFKHLGISDGTDKTIQAEFIRFVTQRDLGSSPISNSNIYKRLRKPIDKGEKSLKEDLKLVRTLYEGLGLMDVVKLINQEIQGLEGSSNKRK